MKKKMLITGANGFVGFHLVNAALKAGFSVYAGVRSNSDISHLKHLDIQYSFLDYGNLNALKKDFREKEYDFIIHAAGATKASNYDKLITVNAVYTRNIAIASKIINPQKLVLISSLAALGPTRYGTEYKIEPNTEPNPITGYGRSKLLAEEYLSAFKDLPWVVLRPTAIYGPRERDILLLIKAINKGIETYFGRNPQYLSFIHVHDVASAAIRACLSNKVHECYNISDGSRYSQFELSGVIKKELAKKTVKITIPITALRLLAQIIEKVNKGSPSILNNEKVDELIAESWYCSIDKAQEQLLFQPQYNLDTGMKNTIEWYKQNKWI